MTENTVEKQDEVQYVNSGQGDNMKATSGDDSLLESASYKEVSKNIFKLAIPISFVQVLDYISILIELIFFGTFGTTQQAGAALGASLATVTGASVIIGMLVAMDPIISQAFGANQMRQIGLALQRGVLLAYVVIFLIFPLWFFSGTLLEFIGQDEEVVVWTQRYLRIYWFGLFAYAINYSLRKFYTNQGIVYPQMIQGVCGIIFMVTCNSIFILLLDHGFTTVVIIKVCNVYFQLCIVMSITLIKKLHKKTWSPVRLETVTGSLPFVRMAIVTTVAVCAEWWGTEIHALISGFFGPANLAAMSIILNIVSVFYMTNLGFALSASVLSGNAVGANQIAKGKMVGKLSLIFVFCLQFSQVLVFFSFSNYWPYLFTKDEQVVKAIQSIVPFVSVYALPDSLQNVLGSILCGIGNVRFPAVVNLVAFYLLGLSVALFLGFYLELGIVGQWYGLVCGISFSFVAQFAAVVCLDWEKLVLNSKKLLLENDQKSVMLEGQECEIELNEMKSTTA